MPQLPGFDTQGTPAPLCHGFLGIRLGQMRIPLQ
jgi:hypothetical protein